jgi:light-regulated signal transduction histidine kinase (bacteriophytochrome)
MSLFRQEIVRSVRWAGEPAQAGGIGPNGPRLTPRKSFENGRRPCAASSSRWTPAERRVAETMRASLIEVVLRLTDEADEPSASRPTSARNC